MNDNCYLCSGPKYSAEHVPAKCFFPKESEYRKNLIKVPSCKNHNEDTSKDDEYVRNIICMSIGNNPIAFKQFINKVIKSFENSPALTSTTFNNPQQVYVKEHECMRPSFAFQIDIERFNKVMKKIGYALYYNEYGKIWQRGLIIGTDCLLGNEYGDLIRDYIKQIKVPVFKGDNPKVFQYKFEETNTTDVILWMKFYEGFQVFVIPNLETNHPDII